MVLFKPDITKIRELVSTVIPVQAIDDYTYEVTTDQATIIKIQLGKTKNHQLDGFCPICDSIPCEHIYQVLSQFGSRLRFVEPGTTFTGETLTHETRIPPTNLDDSELEEIREVVEGKGGELVSVQTVAPPVIIERITELELVNEIQNRISHRWFHLLEWKDKKTGETKRNTVLSISGVFAFVQKLGGFRIIDRKYTETPQFIEVSVLVQDTKTGLESWGLVREYKGTKPKTIENAISKALRNAYRRLIPESVILDLYRQYRIENNLDPWEDWTYEEVK